MQPNDSKPPAQRCAIYTRKSTEEGLEREVNSLEAQRDTCSAYIRSQRHKGWQEMPQRYDDGGYSGGNLVRPALQQLLADIEAARVDVIVIYKIDRLTRSLLDFVRLVDTMERYGVSFVSITQAFDTSDSMGRLILNVLLTFAQFERELTSDRLRDKFAVLKRRGKWVGGRVPFGYDKVDKRLVLYEPEAAIIRDIYDRYPLASSGNQLLRQLRTEGVRNKVRLTRAGIPQGGHLFGPGILHRVLTNPIYLGKIEHRGEWFDGEQPAIVTREQWDRVQAVRKARHDAQIPRQPTGSLLLGILFDTNGRRMTAEVVIRNEKTFRYYTTERTRSGRREGLKTIRTNAVEVEQLALAAFRAFLCDRPALGGALSSLGTYKDDAERSMRSGPALSARIGKMEAGGLRHICQALFRRAELDRERLRLMISCHELSRLLAWDGIGTFRRGVQAPSRQAGRIHLLDIPASIVRETRVVMLPIVPVSPAMRFPPDAKLISLLQEARDAQAAVYANRSMSVAELARERGYGPSHFARLIRLNYLSPDIVASIHDGQQPQGLNRKTLLFASMPLDWAQQRQLLGFTPTADVGQVRIRHNKPWPNSPA